MYQAENIRTGEKSGIYESKEELIAYITSIHGFGDYWYIIKDGKEIVEHIY